MHSAQRLEVCQDQSKHYRNRMSRNDGRRLQIRRGGVFLCGVIPFLQSLAHPRRTDNHAGLTLKSAGKIDDAGACLVRGLPVLARDVLISSEKGEIHLLERGCVYGLDERDFVADGLKLADGSFIVHKGIVGRSERGLAEYVVQFFAA